MYQHGASGRMLGPDSPRGTGVPSPTGLTTEANRLNACQPSER